MIQRLAVIGLGLIGGSLAAAVRSRGLAAEVVAWDSDSSQLQAGLERGLIDRAGNTLADTVAGAQIAVIAVPVAATADALAAIAPALGELELVTDVGSTTASVVADLERVLGSVPPNFVPGHPIAGTERSGAAAALDDLFEGRRVILTPLPATAAPALALARALWAGIGAEVECMDVDRHDRVLAATSHLPHLLAYALVDQLAALDAREEVFAFAAGGFRDFTRIASSSPRMWHDIVRANRDAVLGMIDGHVEHLGGLRQAIAEDDGDRILACFERARAARDRYLGLIEARAGKPA